MFRADLGAIATKFPDAFQVVDGQIRIRPEVLAPLALDDFSFETSAEQEIIAVIKKAVCASDIPTWISVTGLYEQLSMDQRRTVKRGYKSFASFLRCHGMSLAVSTDLLRVSHWLPPKAAMKKYLKAKQKQENDLLQQQNQQQQYDEENNNNNNENSSSNNNDNKPEVIQYTQLHVLNELYDRFPRGREFSLHDFLKTVPEHLRGSLPKNPALWLSTFPQYFVVEGVGTTRDPSDVRIRRARDHAPIDIAVQLYPHIPEEGVSTSALPSQLPPALKAHVEQFGIHNIVDNLSEWLELLDGDLFRKKSMDELEAAIAGKNKPKPKPQQTQQIQQQQQQNVSQQQQGNRNANNNNDDNNDDDVQISNDRNEQTFGDDGSKW